MTRASIQTPLVEGFPQPTTAVSSIDGGLAYRGFTIEDLVEHSNFLETAYLVVQGELPSQEQFADMQALISEASFLDEDLALWIERLPLNASGIDALRTSISLFALSDVYEEETCTEEVWHTLIRVLAQAPLMIAAKHRVGRGWDLAEFRDDLSYAGNLLYGLTDKEPTPLAERALDAFLVLSAEHELNPSTFAARVAASTRTDFLSAVIAGMCVLKGIWHGGPGRQVIDILEAVEVPGAALPIVTSVLKNFERMPGFWHRVYRTSDPRSEIILPFCRELSEEAGYTSMEAVSSAIEAAVWDLQQILPSFDWPAARLLHYLGLDSDLFVPLFAIGRSVGWAAHFLEQQKIPQPIRLRANYTGRTKCPYVPLSERG